MAGNNKARATTSSKFVALSIFLHCLLIGVMIYFAAGGGTTWHRQRTVAKSAPVKIVEAKAVSAKELASEVARLNKIAAKKAANQRYLERQALKLKKQRQQEEQKLQALKRKQKTQAKLGKQKLAKQRAEMAAIAKKGQEEQRRLEKLKKARAEQEANAKAAKVQELARLAKLAAQKRQEQARSRNLQINKLVDKFGLLVKTKVTENWIVQGNDFGQTCVLGVRLGAGGIVLDVEVLTSSGNQALDRSAIAAIYKSSPLPVPDDADAFERMRELRLTLRPEDIIAAIL